MKRPGILLHLLPFIILVSFLIGAYTDLSRKVSDVKHEMIQHLALTELKINEITNNYISKMIGVATHISIDTVIDIEELDYFVQKVVHSENNIISNLGIFEDTTAIYLYPYEPNKSMSNINLAELPIFRDDALRVKNDLEVIITPPSETVQGGIGIMTRMPITLPDGSYWGQLGYMMELDNIIEHLSLDTDHYTYLITQYNNYNGLSNTVYDSGFEDNFLIDEVSINLPSGFWTVQIGYNNLFGLTSPVFYIMVFSSIIFYGLSRYVIYSFKRSEQKLNTVLNSISAFIFVMTDTGVFLSVNKSMLMRLGLDEQDILGKSYNNDSLKKSLGFIQFESFYNRDINETFISSDVSYLDQNNERKWLHTSLQRIDNNIFGEPVIIGTSTDITQIKEFEHKLKSSEERFKSAINQAPIPIMLFDEDGQIININKKWTDLSGYELKDIPTRRDWLEKSSIENEIQTEIFFTSLFESGESFHVGESSILCADGTSRIWDFDSVHIGSSLNERKLLMTVANDLTENRKLQEQLLHKNKMDAIGQLAGGVAHEINNGLSGIMSATQLLQFPERNLDEKSLNYTDIILQTSTRAKDLVTKLLAFGRKGKVVTTDVNMHKILDETTDILYRTIDKKMSISLTKNASKPVLVGDYSEIGNVIINLGTNAAQAMPDGGVIQITTDNITINQSYCEKSLFEIKPGEYIEIEVRDSGSGIKPEDLIKIFEPFFTTKEFGNGIGLGLSAVYGAIQDHHGEIIVKSEVGVGTSFKILLPNAEYSEHKKLEEIQHDTGHGLILFVDDEDFNRILGQEILESLGYKVLLAENGRESVDVYKKNYSEINVVIMDMIMPEMNGSEAFLKMKEINKNCKMIISSGDTKNEKIDELMALGLNGFIHKPYRIGELSKLLNSVLSN